MRFGFGKLLEALSAPNGSADRFPRLTSKGKMFIFGKIFQEAAQAELALLARESLNAKV
jgi:hypothetical protein